jgi:hypothetical protein
MLMGMEMTAVKKLTPKMLNVLAQLAEPGAKAHYMRYLGRLNENPYYFLSSTNETCTAQVKGLMDRGLVKFVERGEYGDGHAEIADAGREYLRTHAPS